MKMFSGSSILLTRTRFDCDPVKMSEKDLGVTLLTGGGEGGGEGRAIESR